MTEQTGERVIVHVSYLLSEEITDLLITPSPRQLHMSSIVPVKHVGSSSLSEHTISEDYEGLLRITRDS